MEIKDYKCTYGNAAGINVQAVEHLELNFPEAHKHWESMSRMAAAIKAHEKAEFCTLPFCHTVEAEALGGKVNYGDVTIGPRAAEYITNSVEDLLDLPAVDYSCGRISEVLKACRYLHSKEHDVMLEIAGPFTILNTLIDARYLYKAMRRQPEVMKRLFDKIRAELMHYIQKALDNGVNLISYADSAGGVNILGPKMAAQMVEDFTGEFLKEAKHLIDHKALMVLCPKTALAMIGTGRAEFVNLSLSAEMTYGRACVKLIGKEHFTGQMCIQNSNRLLKKKEIKVVRLL